MSSTDALKGNLRTDRWKRRFGAAVGAITVVAVCIAIRSVHGPVPANAKSATPADSNQTTRPGADAKQLLQIVAQVNRDTIGRQELAQECLDHFGGEVLDAMLNKYLIDEYCRQRQITVTRRKVSDEVDRLAKKFGISTDQWLKMIEDERHIKPEQYADDIVWPMLALKKIAADQIQPTQQEIEDAFEAKFGEAVKTRLIVLTTEQRAEQVLREARANPAGFPALARKYSVDPSGAPMD